MSLGTPELAILFVLVLLLFGASRLPKLARGVGESMRELRRAADAAEEDPDEARTEA